MKERIKALQKILRRNALGALLLSLVLANLANYELDLSPSCQCSGYRGLMELDPTYIVLTEGSSRSGLAEFPTSSEWSFGQLPNPEIVESIQTSGGGTEFEYELFAAQRFSGPPSAGVFVTAYLETVEPGIRTHLEIKATPLDPDDNPEGRRLTIVGRLPYIRTNFSPWYAGLNQPPFFAVFVVSQRTWSFEFNTSDAPSIAEVTVSENSPNYPVVTLREPLIWELVPGQLTARGGRSVCAIWQPIHIRAFEADRVLRKTILTNILAPRDATTGECPNLQDLSPAVNPAELSKAAPGKPSSTRGLPFNTWHTETLSKPWSNEQEG